MRFATLLLATSCLAGPAAFAQYANQGIAKNEIVLGTIQDLSGPIAAFGKQARNGMLLRIDEANEQGGVHGRKLRLLGTIIRETIGTIAEARKTGYSPTKRLGSDLSRVSQIQDGRWKVVSDYVKP
jgi:hypothetical protein